MKILSQSEVAKAIKSLKSRAAKVQSDIHLCAVSTLVHMQLHGDYTGAVLLMNALPSGQRVKGVAAWYKHNSGGKFTLRQDKKQGNIWVGTLSKDRVAEDFDIEGASKVTFAEFTAEVEPRQVSEESIRKYLERLVANDEMLDETKPKVTAEAKERANVLLAMFAA
jgi:hypothetical protein